MTLSCLILLAAILRYWFYRYQMLDDGIQIRLGVLFKKQLNLKFHRVQNVNIRHPFYFRPLGLVTLKIDSAGSTREEVNIAALTFPEAQAIRQTIQHRKSQPLLAEGESTDLDAGAIVVNAEGVKEEQAFYTRTFDDLVIHGLTNNRAWIIVGAIFGFLQSTPFSVSDGVDLLQGFVGSIISNESVAFTVLLFSIALVLTVVITALLSVLGSIVTYYGFELFRSDESLMVHRGLFTRHEINMQKSRVQTIYLRQDWLDLILQRVNVIYEQLSHSLHNVEGAENSKRILVPSAREWERSRLINEIFDLPDIASLEFQAISKWYFYKYALIWSTLYLLFSAGFEVAETFNTLLLIPVWAVHMSLLYMNWLRAGLAVTEDYVIVRKGIIGIDYIVFPAYKLQAVDHVQSLLMKRRQLSNIVFHTASRMIRLPYLPSQHVHKVLNYCLYAVEANDRSWM